jgi:hypothetical protein
MIAGPLEEIALRIAVEKRRMDRIKSIRSAMRRYEEKVVIEFKESEFDVEIVLEEK